VNVFVLPSWYPHRCHPLEGVYIKDQALALGDLRPDWNIVLSLWNQGKNLHSLAHLRRSPACLLETWRERAPRVESLSPNVTTVRRSTPEWSPRLAHGNRAALLAANRRNLDDAVLRHGPVDVLHAHVAFPAGWVARQLARERDLPYVVTEHMGPFPLPSYARADGTLADYIEDPLVDADATIAVGPALAQRLVSFGLPVAEVIPNLIDERLYDPRPRPADGGFVFATICGMERGKGIVDLLRAARRFLDGLVPAGRDRVRFRLGGSGPALDEFREESRRLGLDPWVTWLGLLTREEARREFSACDVFVLPSHHESFGIVFIEAMASGRPSIATRCGGPESILDERTGILVDVSDVPALAAAMGEVFHRPDRFDREEIVRAFHARFGRAAVVDRLEGVYRAAIAHRRGREAGGPPV
jgi:glycosyltransferase involved in cell wall biosynthesis